MKRFYTSVFLIFALLTIASAQETQPKINWNGYTQLRATSDFSSPVNFDLRRLKFWLKSGPGFSDHWSFKAQVLFTSFLQERLFLQDIKVRYKTGLFSFDIGQFIPAYSLEGAQPDYNIPAVERSIVINGLSPNGTLGVRDIGVQANFTTKNKLLQSSIGYFNGYGIFEYRFNNDGYMLTHKTAISLPINENQIHFGYSLLYREAEDLQIPKVLPDSVFFSGTDFRYNFFAMFKSNAFEIQAEYLNADLERQFAYGYYILSAINIKKNQLVFSFEEYHDLINETSNHPWYRAGYNFMFKKNKLKLFFDNYFQIGNNKIENYYATIQLQVFFRQK